MKKKLLSLLIVLCMVISLLPATVLAVETPTQVANGDELKAAIAAGGSIQLSENITFETATCLHITESVTLDLNGKTISAVAEGGCTDGSKETHFILVKSGGHLTIEDTNGLNKGTITASYKGLSALHVVDVGDGGKLTVTGGTIMNDNSTAEHGSASVYVNENGTFYLQGGVIHGEKAKGTSCPVSIYKGTMFMSGGKISATCPNTNGIVANSGSKLTITGGDITDLAKAGISTMSTNVSIQGGSFKGELNPKWIAQGSYGVCDGTITTVVTATPKEYVAAVNDVLFYTGDNGADLAVQNAVSRGKLVLRKTPTAGIKTATRFDLTTTLTVVLENGATFDSTAITIPENSVIREKHTETNTTVYSVEVDPQYAEARVGDVYYTDLTSAFTAANNGGTVVLLKDLDWGASSKSTRSSCTLDLNGHTISSNQGTATTSAKYVLRFYGTGTFTIKDTSTAKTGAIINTSQKATYKGYALYVENGTVSILDGAFKGRSYDLGANKNGNIIVSGGHFTSDPSKYVESEYAVVASDKTGYTWMVVPAGDTPAEVVPAAPEVADPQLTDASEEEMRVATDVKTALTNPDTPPTVSADMMTAAANTIANDNQTTAGEGLAALEEQGVADDTVAKEDVTIVVQPYLDIEITDVTIENGTKTLTLDITPMYQKVATTADIENEEIVVNENDQTVGANAVVLEFGELKVTGAVTVEIPLPTGFAADGDLNVGHKGYVYTGTVSKNVLTFTNPHGFSEFTIGVEGAVAKIGDTQYSTLEKAIADAKHGETVFVLKDGLTAEMSGDSRTITVKNGTEGKITFKVNGKDYTLEKKDNEVQITYTRPTSGGGSVSTYTLTFEVNGGSALKKLTRAYGTTIDLSDYIPTRAGYTFDGWYSDKDLTEKVTSIKLNSNTTVYAKWTMNADGTVAGFTDVKIGDWFAEEVQYVVDKGLMSGMTSTTFAPNSTTTRGMIVAILYRMENEPTAPASAFTDVNEGAYYEKAIDWAAANEIVKGVSETTFAPDQAITREQLAAILYRYAQFKGYNVSKMNKLDSYADAAQVSPYAVSAMQWANAENLITGKSATILDPKGDATRAEVSSILMRFCENIAK